MFHAVRGHHTPHTTPVMRTTYYNINHWSTTAAHLPPEDNTTTIHQMSQKAPRQDSQMKTALSCNIWGPHRPLLCVTYVSCDNLLWGRWLLLIINQHIMRIMKFHSWVWDTVFVFATFIFRVPLDLRIKPKKSKIMHIKGKEFRIGRPWWSHRQTAVQVI